MSYYDPSRKVWLVDKRLSNKYLRFLNRELNYDKNCNDRSNSEKNIRGWFRKYYGNTDVVVRDTIFADHDHFMNMDRNTFSQLRDRYYSIKLMQFLRCHMLELELYLL